MRYDEQRYPCNDILGNLITKKDKTKKKSSLIFYVYIETVIISFKNAQLGCHSKVLKKEINVEELV